MKINPIIFFFLLSPIIIGQSLPDGYTVFYYDNGKISSEGTIINNIPEGIWKSYYSSGILKSVGKRKNGTPDSLWVFFTETGDTLSKIDYMYGKKNGYTYKYRKNLEINKNIMTSKELNINDKLEGKCYYFSPEGNLYMVSYYENGVKSGKEYVFDGNNLITIVNIYKNGNLIEIEKINRRDKTNKKIGVWREYYSDFRIKREVTYTDDKKNGIYKEFDKSGKMIVSLIYRNDMLIEGEFDETNQVIVKTENHSNGKLKFYGTYKNDIPIGIHNFYNDKEEIIKSLQYNEEGTLTGEGKVDQEGNKQSEWTLFYNSGSVKAKGSYKNNSQTGTWTYYFENGNIEQKGEFIDNRYEGKWIWYYSNGHIKTHENYINGLEDGEFTEYDLNGKIISHGSYIDGQKEGLWQVHYGDIREEGNYAVGMKDGKWKQYYPNGKIRFEGNYIQGNADGKHTYYYANGNAEEEQFYNAGIKVKTWNKYDDVGSLLIAVTYKNNQEIKINGEPIKLDE